MPIKKRTHTVAHALRAPSRRHGIANRGEATRGLCSSCAYWNKNAGGEQAECRRLPPMGGETNFRSDGQPRWPVTDKHHWCGEHRPASGS